jgi:hypothetical protein
MTTCSLNRVPLDGKIPLASPSERSRIVLGLDVHIASIMVVLRRGALPPEPARRLDRRQLLALVGQFVASGATVHCVQESCGFGFVLHRELEAAGAKSIVITPVRLDVQRRGRKTDRLDARALCLRLSAFVEGDHDQLRPIRIPTAAEQQQRALSRRREFLGRELRRLENHGRAVLLEHRYQSLPAGWWGPRKWKKIQALLDSWLLPILSDLRKLLLELKSQLDALILGSERSNGRCCENKRGEDSLHRTRAEAPNAPKLSDCGARRAGCMVGERRWPEAASVTRGAVRCSAWLGVRLIEFIEQAFEGLSRCADEVAVNLGAAADDDDLVTAPAKQSVEGALR